MPEAAKLSGTRPRLYHAPSSYQAMIPRLALIEGGVAYESVVVDIHLKTMQQRLDHVQLNPNVTVPTLVLPDCIFDHEFVRRRLLERAARNPDLACRRARALPRRISGRDCMSFA